VSQQGVVTFFTICTSVTQKIALHTKNPIWVVTSFTTFTPARIQSDDLKVNSRALYQLSYTGNNNEIVEIPRDMYWYLYDFSLF
jgi:hypothetical protein